MPYPIGLEGLTTFKDRKEPETKTRRLQVQLMGFYGEKISKATVALFSALNRATVVAIDTAVI